MTTEPRREELLDLALGLLDPAEARALEAHAAACVACRAELDSLRRTHRLVAGLPPLLAPERGAAILLAAARQAAALAEARSPRWRVPRWLAGGALGLAGAAALALLVLRVEGPPTRGPLSDDREALLGRAAQAPVPAAAPAMAPAAPAPAATVAAEGSLRPERAAPKRPLAAPPAATVVAPREDRGLPLAEAAPAKKAEAMQSTEQAAGSGALQASGERRKEARAALAEEPLRASRAAAFAGNVADGARLPCRLEQRRQLFRDEEGRVVGRVREGRYPTDGGEVALRVEERFGADGRLLGGTVLAGGRHFTLGAKEVAQDLLEPLPGVRLAASAAEAEQSAPRCEP